ncbi:MAG TPA: hypothetical protein VGH87_20880 [Polyangiaceae bacterium]
MHHRVVLLFLGACACNSAPKDSCVDPSTSVAAAGAAASSCTGKCVSLDVPDAGAIPFCAIDCTTGGQSSCQDTRTCASLQSLGILDSGTSYCIYECAKADAGSDAAACPSGYNCYTPLGVCF